MDFAENLRTTLVFGKGTRPILYLLLVLCCWLSASLASPQGASIQKHRRIRQIVFEEEVNQNKDNPMRFCKIENGEVFMPSESKCYPLLRQGPCVSGELVHLDLRTGRGRCSPNPCAVKGCGTPPCPDTFVKVPLITGEVLCDCDFGKIFWPPQRKCYGAFTEGPCKPGQVIATAPSGEALCRPRMCPEGYLLIRDECHPEGAKGPCRNNTKVGLDLHTQEPECLDIEPHFLVRSPNLHRDCKPGSRMNHARLCINTLATSKPKPPPVCSPGFQPYFNRCIRRL